MAHWTKTRTRALLIALLFLLVGLAGTPSAAAHHKPGHSQGGGNDNGNGNGKGGAGGEDPVPPEPFALYLASDGSMGTTAPEDVVPAVAEAKTQVASWHTGPLDHQGQDVRLRVHSVGAGAEASLAPAAGLWWCIFCPPENSYVPPGYVGFCQPFGPCVAATSPVESAGRERVLMLATLTLLNGSEPVFEASGPWWSDGLGESAVWFGTLPDVAHDQARIEVWQPTGSASTRSVRDGAVLVLYDASTAASCLTVGEVTC